MRPLWQISNLRWSFLTLWFCCFLGICPRPARAQTAQPSPSSSEGFNAQSAAAGVSLQRWYNPQTGLWDTAGWWNAANCVDALEDLVVANHTLEYLSIIQNTFDRKSTNKFLNDYYDDEGWWANAWIRAYDLTGEARYLAMARDIFHDMALGWDDHCGGGIWWRKDRRYKNAIANELFFLVAARLHQRTPGDSGPQSYYDWAAKEWEWFRASGMINPQSLVNDGLDYDCQNNGGTTWSYNQGVLIGALVEWHRVTGDTNCLNQAIAIADAALLNLVNSNGVLREPREFRTARNHDVPQFKGIFMRHLGALADIAPKPAYWTFLLANARSIWTNARNERNELGYLWAGPFDTADAVRQSSALAALCAASQPMTEISLSASNTIVAAGMTHDIGQADRFGNWQADRARNKTSGFLSKAVVGRASKPAHGRSVSRPSVAQFELKVDNFSHDNSLVATVSVADADTGTVIASREITRNQFKSTLFQPFALRFRASRNHRYEFRVLWNYSPDAPRLTQRSLVAEVP
ncbi:MAG TPA: glycoside hydrolase family 76 protein [Verrucomicrobiae bacterium]|nr:glycoside hydrolase family 76 protein [Verrucomicrobiae bacterium]